MTTKRATWIRSLFANRLIRQRAGLLVLLIPLLAAGYHWRDWLPPRGMQVAVSPDGKLIASLYRHHPNRPPSLLEIRELQSGRRLLWHRSEIAITSIAFAPTSRRLAVGHEDGFVKIWEIGQAYPAVRFRAASQTLPWLAYTNGGKSLFIVDILHSQAILVDANSGHRLSSVESDLRFFWLHHEGRIARVAHALRHAAPTTRFYQASEEGIRPQYDCTATWPACFLPDGKFVARSRRNVYVWDPERQETVNRVLTSVDSSMARDMAGSLRYLALLHGMPPRITIWDRKHSRQTEIPGTEAVEKLAMVPGAEQLAAVTRGGTTMVFDIRSKKLQRAFRPDGTARAALWTLLGLLLCWYGLWVWSGVRNGVSGRASATRALTDALLLSGLGLAGSVSRLHALPGDALGGVLLATTLVTVTSVFSLVILLSELRWSLRVCAALVTVAVAWAAIFSSVQQYQLTVFLTAAALMIPTWFGLLLLLRRVGIRWVWQGWSESGTRPVRTTQIPLLDLMLATAATAMVVAAGRGLRLGDVPAEKIAEVAIAGGLMLVTSCFSLFAATRKRFLLAVSLTLSFALFMDWLAAVWAGGVGWFDWSPLLSVAVLVLGAGLALRLNGGRCRKVNTK